MQHDLLSQIGPLVSQYGMAVLFPIAVVEGPAVSIVAGALVASGQFGWLSVAILLVAADLVGDALYYSLGRWGHTPFLRRLERWLSLTEERFRPIEEGFRRHDWKILLIGKTQPFGSVVLFFAGATRMPVGRYLAFNLLATIPKVILFEGAGYLLGSSIARSMKIFDYVTFILFGIGAVLLYVYYRVRKYLKKEISNDAPL